MTKIDEILDEKIIPALEGISQTNGYLNDVSVLDGYFVHYANDLFQQKDNISFPCIAFEPERDIIESQAKGGKVARITRVVRLIGAVSAIDRSTVNKSLNSLAFDVRRAASIDSFSDGRKTVTVTFGDCVYDLPKAQDQYALFDMKININYVEDWK